MRRILLSLTVAVALLGAACMGQFALTRKLYGWNSSLTGNAIINHIVFWALAFIVPIYGLAITVDAFIFNVIEFWTGSNILASNQDGDAPKLERLADGGARVDVGDDSFTATPTSDRSVEVRSAKHGVIGSAELLENGSMLIKDTRGGMELVVEREELELVERVLGTRP